MEKCLLEVEGLFFAGFSILSFLSFVQWALTTASINAFWIHKPNGLFHTINIWEMQLRHLSTALKVFAHFSVHVCSRWSLIMLIDANYFQTFFGWRAGVTFWAYAASNCIYFSFQGKKIGIVFFPSQCLNLLSGIYLLVCVTEAFSWRPEQQQHEAAGGDGHLLWCKVK